MPRRFPVSIKGVVLRENQVLLLRNERDEWELPGGRLEEFETPETCVEREFLEETALEVRASRILDSWVYEPLPKAFVVIVTYGCIERNFQNIVRSDEHQAIGWFDLETLDELPMPEGYRRSVRAWYRSLREE